MKSKIIKLLNEQTLLEQLEDNLYFYDADDVHYRAGKIWCENHAMVYVEDMELRIIGGVQPVVEGVDRVKNHIERVLPFSEIKSALTITDAVNAVLGARFTFDELLNLFEGEEREYLIEDNA
ncbi:hypothetical protein VPHD479_0048 [Vibrio phage D479]